MTYLAICDFCGEVFEATPTQQISPCCRTRDWKEVEEAEESEWTDGSTQPQTLTSFPALPDAPLENLEKVTK